MREGIEPGGELSESDAEASQRYQDWMIGRGKKVEKLSSQYNAGQQLAKEGGESGDEKKELAGLMGMVEAGLARDWAIDSLSTIEAARLSRICHDCLSQAKRERQEGSTMKFDPVDESEARWLDELYGIDPSYFEDHYKRDIIYVVIDHTDKKAYLFKNKEDANSRLAELRDQGRDEYIDYQPSEEWKEYIRRIREGAHLL